jgi:hypothetical protein
MYSRVAGIPINCIIEISKGRWSWRKTKRYLRQNVLNGLID